MIFDVTMFTSIDKQWFFAAAETSRKTVFFVITKL